MHKWRKNVRSFNQVKINVALLDAIQQVPSYAKFLKDMFTKKRKINVPKKDFLASNISEIVQSDSHQVQGFWLSYHLLHNRSNEN